MANIRVGITAIILLLALTSLRAQTNDTSSVNTRNVVNFMQAIHGTNALRIGSFGDSVCDSSTGGKIEGFIAPLAKVYGRSGGLLSGFPYLYYQFAGGSATLPKDTNWWSNHIFLTNGATVTYLATIKNGPSNVTDKVWCDSAAVYFLNEPGAGSFTIAISTNGGAYGTVATINANAARAGIVTNFSLPLNYYTLKLTGTSGTNTIIDAGMWVENQLNVVPCYFPSPGNSFADWNAVATNVSWPIWKFVNPKLVLIEAKDTPEIFITEWAALERMFTNCTPTMDPIYIGTTPVIIGDETFAIPQNAVMRSMATNYNRFYWDGYSIFSSYQQATDLGYTRGDGVHFNAAGGLFLGDLLWKQVWNSPLNIVGNSSAIHLQWPSYSNIFYQLQYVSAISSTNWSDFGASRQGTGANLSADDSPCANTNRFYRVQTLF